MTSHFSKDRKSPQIVRCITLSVGIDLPLRDGRDNSWTRRRERLIDLLKDYDFDVIALQDITGRQLDQLMAEQYFTNRSFGCYDHHHDLQLEVQEKSDVSSSSPSSTDKEAYLPIIFNRDKFALEDSGHFWFSRQPALPYTKSWQMVRPRACTWCKLTFKGDKELSFYVFNAHLDQSKLSQLPSVEMIREHVDNFVTYYDEESDRDRRLPCIVLANLNCLSCKRSMVYKYLLDGEDPQIPHDDTESDLSTSPTPDDFSDISDEEGDSDVEEEEEKVTNTVDSTAAAAAAAVEGGNGETDTTSGHQHGKTDTAANEDEVEEPIQETQTRFRYLHFEGADTDDTDDDDDDDDDLSPLRLFSVVPTDSVVHILATPETRVKVHQTQVFQSLYMEPKAKKKKSQQPSASSSKIHRPLAADLELL